MQYSQNYVKLRNFLESLTDNSMLIDTIDQGFISCFEAHTGIIRNLNDIVNKYDLKAKTWPESIKKEIFSDIDRTISGRSSMGTSGKNIGSIKDLEILDTDFSPESMLNISMDQLDDKTKRNMRERIELLFADPTQKIYKISNVPNDIQRYFHQYSTVMRNGASGVSPVLFINRNGKYELYEGNHRLLAVIKIAVGPLVDEILASKYDVKKLIPDEIPGLKSRIFKSLPDSEIQFSINSHVGIPPERNKFLKLVELLKNELKKLF